MTCFFKGCDGFDGEAARFRDESAMVMTNLNT
jgi:hypothetical protein